MSKTSDAINAGATKIGTDLDTIVANGLPDPSIPAALDNLNAVVARADALAASSAPVSPVASLTVSPTSLTLAVGGAQGLTVTASDAAGNPVKATIAYVSDTPAVATVDVNGVVTAVAAGSAIITVSSGTAQPVISGVSVS